MNHHNLLLTAADTLFFRDGRPFTMGEDTYAEGGTFPPSPSVLFGALCSAFTSENPNIWQNLTIKGFCLKSSNDKHQWFPLPKDIVVTKKKNVEKLKLIDKPEFANYTDELSLILAKESNEKVEESNFFLHQRFNLFLHREI